MEFCGHCLINILQNISQKRAENQKKITKLDVRYAMCAAYLTIYPGKTMYATGKNRFFYGHESMSFLYYVKGLSGGKASVCWGVACWGDISEPNGKFLDGNYASASEAFTVTHSNSIINCGINVNPPQIYEDLQIKEGEVKMILEVSLATNDTFTFLDGKSVRTVPVQRRFGLYLAPVRSPRVWSYLKTVVIFTPKPGLFNETPPA
jgi:hypothetical protein